jgi:hypothetical protein
MAAGVGVDIADVAAGCAACCTTGAADFGLLPPKALLIVFAMPPIFSYINTLKLLSDSNCTGS